MKVEKKYYHMTSVNLIKSINKEGLIPKNEDNSKLVNDNQVKVFFSEGFTGAIALFIDFDIIYNNIKSKKTILENKRLNDKVLKSNSLEEYLGIGVYLVFEDNNLYNERNFENGCTSKIIDKSLLKVLILKDLNNKKITYSRYDIVKYMMAKTAVKKIKYYGVEYTNSPNFEEATKKIQDKVNVYYNKHKIEIDKYRNNNYELIEIPLSEFIKTYID